MRPSEALAAKRDEVRAIIARYPVANPRIFGSVARGEDVEGSDLDILVDKEPGLSYFDLAGMEIALEDLLSIPVDIGITSALREELRDDVLREAQPL